MADIKTLIEHAYSAFNRRDIDGALALMTQDVSWPKASEGGKVFGKEEVRAYWTRQWGEFDLHVEPLAITEGDGGADWRTRPSSPPGEDLLERAPMGRCRAAGPLAINEFRRRGDG